MIYFLFDNSPQICYTTPQNIKKLSGISPTVSFWRHYEKDPQSYPCNLHHGDRGDLPPGKGLEVCHSHHRHDPDHGAEGSR